MNSQKLLTLIAFLVLVTLPSHLLAQISPWEGDWITDLGEMNLIVEGDEISGDLGANGSVIGTVDGDKAAISYEVNEKKKGKATLELDKDNMSFKRSGKGKTLRGWKLSEDVAEETADFSGHWLSNQGNVVLQQKGDKVTGIYGSQGLATLEGTVKGNRLIFNWKKFHFKGKAFIEQNKDGSRIYGCITCGCPTAGPKAILLM